MTPEQAVNALDMLEGSDPEVDHADADEILLKVVHPDIRAAYERLVHRAAWWATA